jgi:hypothetical protein
MRESPSSGETGKRTGRGKPLTTSGSPLRIVSNPARSGTLAIARTDDDEGEMEETQVVVLKGEGREDDEPVPTSTTDTGGIADALQQQQRQAHHAQRPVPAPVPSGLRSAGQMPDHDVFGTTLVPKIESSSEGERIRSLTEPGRRMGTLEEYTRLIESDAENDDEDESNQTNRFGLAEAEVVSGDKYTGPAKGLKGRPRYRMLSRPLAPAIEGAEPDGFDIIGDGDHGIERTRIDLEPVLSGELAVGGGFDSMETVVPFDHRVGGEERGANRTRRDGEAGTTAISWRHLAPSGTHSLPSNSMAFSLGPTLSSLDQPDSLGAASTSSRILEPVDWENYSPHYLEGQSGATGSIRGGSMMLVPPPDNEERSGLIRTSTGSLRLDHQAIRERVGQHVYWNMFENTREYDNVAPLSASTNSNSARDSNTSASAGNTSVSFDDDTGISTTRLVGSYDRFGGLQDEDELNSSEPEDGDDAARIQRQVVVPMELGMSRRPGSAEAYVFRPHSASRSIELPSMNEEEDDRSAIVYESSEGGRASEAGPIRTTRSSLRTRNANAGKPVPEASASRNAPMKKPNKRKGGASSHPPQSNANSKPVRSLGDRGQGRKPSALAQPDSPEDFDTTGMHPDAIAAKKARRREINRKSARTLREKRKAELESAWSVVDELRSEMSELMMEVQRERELRMAMQEALIRVSDHGIRVESSIDVDQRPVS